YVFFQAEDGIRDRNVTGVQTCALPILVSQFMVRSEMRVGPAPAGYMAGRANPASRRLRPCCRKMWLIQRPAWRPGPPAPARTPEIGRASCRDRVYIARVERRVATLSSQ